MTDEQENYGLKRSIDWKQGLLIGIGIPLVIIPSIGVTTSLLWAASIALWALCVLQGFIQNMAFAELATAFPNISGIPGFAQEIFKSKDRSNKRVDRGRLIGGFCAWAYWLVWAPGMAVFIIVICAYLQGLFPGLVDFDFVTLNLIVGVLVLGGLAVISSRGLKHSATLGLIVAVLTIVPVAIISLAPFVTGDFHPENITSALTPADWTWNGDHILMLLGLVVIAQWSACCWEVVAVYGPEYKQPRTDIKKALLAVGAFCLVMMVLIQTSVIGTIGVDGVLLPENFNAPLLPVAAATFGTLGADVIIVFLIVACILLIQIGYSAGARTLHSMALEGNLPRWFAKTNAHGEPMRAIFVIAIFNLLLLLALQGDPVAVLATSAIGYVFVFGIALFAYVKASRDPRLKSVERPYKAPRGWKWVALILGIFQLPFLLIGAIYINNLEYGMGPNLIGFGVLALFFPLWVYTQYENRKLQKKDEAPGRAEPS